MAVAKIPSVSDETKLALLEQTTSHLYETLSEIKHEIKSSKEESRTRFITLEDKFKRLDEKIDFNFKWIMGVMMTLFSGLYATALGGMIARLFKWI